MGDDNVVEIWRVFLPIVRQYSIFPVSSSSCNMSESCFIPYFVFLRVIGRYNKNTIRQKHDEESVPH